MVYSEGKNWSTQRKWMRSTLTKLGLSTKNGNVMETIISNEVQEFCEIIASLAAEGPVSIKQKFAPCVSNIVVCLTTGRANK